jgi:hypothetical protein
VIVFKGGGLSSSGSRSGTARASAGWCPTFRTATERAPTRNGWTSTRNLDDVVDPRIAAKVMRAHAEQNPRYPATNRILIGYTSWLNL